MVFIGRNYGSALDWTIFLVDNISVTAGRNFLVFGMMIGYDAHSLKMLILSGIQDEQTKMFVSEKRFPRYKDTQQKSIVPFYQCFSST